MPSRPLGRQRAQIAGILALGALGCMKWSAITTPGASTPAIDSLAKYRITSRAGESREFFRLFFRNDSLLGQQLSTNLRPIPGLPVTDIAKVEIRKPDVVKTAAITLPVILIVVAAAGQESSGGRVWGNDSTTFSCPLVYSWDGTTWRLDSGTFGGAITPALARTDLDNLVHARAINGTLRFRMTAEAPETEHVDALRVIAVDHPAGTTVAPDARANGTFHVLGAIQPPLTARDRFRTDVLPQVAATDGIAWTPRLDGRDPANPMHLRDGVELTFARPAVDAVHLVVDGQNTEWSAQLMGQLVAAHGRATAPWYAPATTASASLPLLRAQQEQGFLTVTIWDGSAWRAAGTVWEAGPEVAKRQVLPLDLRGIPGPALRVRLESAPAFWSLDHVGLSPALGATARTRELATTRVTSDRFPDGLERLAGADGTMLDMELGDVVDITVRDASAPASGLVRSYLLRTTGWYRIHGRDAEDPDLATLRTLGETDGAARLAVERLNEALARLAARAADAGQR